MDRRIPLIGAWAGLLAVAGIVGYHLALTLLAGQRVSGTTETQAIAAYYDQPIVAVLGVTQFLVVVPFLVMAQVLRQTLTRSEGERLLAGVGALAASSQAAVVLTVAAAQAALVVAVEAGEGVSGLFRFWDALYNSGLYALEATWVLAFGLAMRGSPAFPRALGWLSPLTSVLLAVNVLAFWVGIPDVLTLPSAVALVVWLILATVGLRRQVGLPAPDVTWAPAV